jgi:streptogramin lyase
LVGAVVRRLVVSALVLSGCFNPPTRAGREDGCLPTCPEFALCEAGKCVTRMTEFNASPASGIAGFNDPRRITSGIDGNLWFTMPGWARIGRLTPEGTLTTFSAAPSADQAFSPLGIVAGPDGNLWFTRADVPGIGRITPDGVVTELPTPPGMAESNDIAVGPDGNLWFTTRSDRVARINPDLTISEFVLGGDGDKMTLGISAGPDGNVWFSTGAAIGRITPSGTITEFELLTPGLLAFGITTGPDGNLWFAEDDFYGPGKIGRITPAGDITEFDGAGTSFYPERIVAGPDGNLWFTNGDGEARGIGRMTPQGKVTLFPLRSSDRWPTDIVLGPDGSLWFTESPNRVGRLAIP